MLTMVVFERSGCGQETQQVVAVLRFEKYLVHPNQCFFSLILLEKLPLAMFFNIDKLGYNYSPLLWT